MKPEQEPAKTESAPAPSAPTAHASAQTGTSPMPNTSTSDPQQLAEPPKNIEFTEVSPQETSSVLATATAEHDAQTEKEKAPESAKPAAKQPHSNGGSKPLFALAVAFVVFAALAAAAYYAYTKSK